MAPAKRQPSKPANGQKRTINPILARKLEKSKSHKSTSGTTSSKDQIFRNKVFVLTGSLVISTGSVPMEQATRWITGHGGKVQKEVDEETTHVICSIEEFSRMNPEVSKAYSLSTPKIKTSHKRKIKILTFEWIEDCLSLSSKPKLLPENEYSLHRTKARIQETQQAQVEYTKDFNAGIKKHNELYSTLYAIYCDPNDGFSYNIRLSRIDIRGPMKVENYELYLFQSVAKPHTYMFGAKYNQKRCKSYYYRELMRPKEFEDAFKDFKFWFRRLTKREWDLRLEPWEETRRIIREEKNEAGKGGQIVGQIDGDVEGGEKRKGMGRGKGKGKEDGNEAVAGEEDMKMEVDEGKRLGEMGVQEGEIPFTYKPPVLGAAVGAVPDKYVRPELRPDWVGVESVGGGVGTEMEVDSDSDGENESEDGDVDVDMQTDEPVGGSETNREEGSGSGSESESPSGDSSLSSSQATYKSTPGVVNLIRDKPCPEVVNLISSDEE